MTNLSNNNKQKKFYIYNDKLIRSRKQNLTVFVLNPAFLNSFKNLKNSFLTQSDNITIGACLQMRRKNNLTRIRYLAFVAALHKNGKKLWAEKILMMVFNVLGFKLKCKQIFILINICFDLLEPYFFLRRFRKSGRLFLIPVPATKRKRAFLAMKFLFLSIREQRKRSLKSLSLLIADEIIAILSKQKTCVSLKEKKLFVQSVLKCKFSTKGLKINVGKIIM